MMPYWFQQTIAVLPLALWLYLLMGLPWALIALPHSHRSRRMMVVALSFAFGPSLLTAWMLILGTLGGRTETALLTPIWVWGGTVILTAIGTGIAWQRQRSIRSSSIVQAESPLKFDERLLIFIIVVAVIVRWVVTAYWSFTAYDALWVYGYEGRLYQMLGYIPQHIGYYPQFMPLQYAAMQLWQTGFDDHAARVVIPFIHVGSILAVYLLGQGLFKRRVGLYAAAIWTLYPHVAQWAHIGDLEVPLTFSLTLTIGFFLRAWFTDGKALRRRYAVIAGMCFGLAMWTKPTGGAFIWGVILLVVVDLLRVGFNWRAWYPRLEVAAITGLACLPLGAAWYIRNAALGLDVLVFPHASWLSRASRSGDLLSFPILALLLTIAWSASRGRLRRGWAILVGVILLLVSTMPSSPLFAQYLDRTRVNPPASYMNIREISALILGLLMIIWGFQDRLWRAIPPTAARILWAYGLILPYFMTWFWSYSYHARLSFAMVPVLLLPIAWVLAQWHFGTRWQRWARSGFIVLASLPALLIPIMAIAPTHDWLWTDRYPDDFTKTSVFNPGVGLVAQYLWGFQEAYQHPVVVVAPGEQRLPFFFPEATIISDTLPTDYSDLAAATHFIYGSQAQWRYEDDTHPVAPENRIIASLGRERLFKPAMTFNTGTFRYELYELTLDARYQMPEAVAIEDEVLFGEAIRYVGYTVSTTQLLGNRVFVRFVWQAEAVPPTDNALVLDLVTVDDGQIYATWQPLMVPNPHAYYATNLWEVGEYIEQTFDFYLDNASLPQVRDRYRLQLSFVDQQTGERIPVMINGEAAVAYQMSLPFSYGD